MKIFIFLLTFLFSVSVLAGNVGDTDQWGNLLPYHYDYKRAPHHNYHHSSPAIYLNRDTVKLFDNMFQTIDDRIDLLDNLARDMYAAACAISNRNQQACTKLAESLKAITKYDSKHQEVFCVVDLLHAGEPLVHDLNIPMSNSGIFEGALEICKKFPKQTGDFYRTLVQDFVSYLKSGDTERRVRKGEHVLNYVGEHFLLFRANIRPPVAITPTYGPLSP